MVTSPPRRFAVTSLAVLAAVVVPLLAHAAPRGEFSRADEEIIAEKWPEALVMPSGMRYIVLKEGTGPKPQIRQRVHALYRGSMLDGTEFSAALDPNEPFKFVLGAGQVILGWEQAFLDMQVGEKRLLIIPFTLGYGLRGRPPDIPNRATLIFEVELLAIE